ncbi:MAG: hypothetical protein ABJN40_04020 [Sneathiella sp.]
MKYLILVLSVCLSSTSAQAQTIGIKFADIPPGSQFHYETIGGGNFLFADKYVGKIDTFHVVDGYSIENGKLGRKPITRRYYNEPGLLVRSETLSLDKTVEYIPFNCRRSMAQTCQHVRKVTNRKTGTVLNSITHKFESNLSDGKLTVTSFFSNGKQGKTRYTFDKRGIITHVHNPEGALSQGEKLIREIRP